MGTKSSALFRCLISKRSLRILGVFGAAVLMSAAVVFALNPSLLGLFELESDANATHNAGTSPPDDWQTVNAGGPGTACPAGTHCFVRTGVLQDIIGSDGGNDDIFTGGGSKDISDI